MHRVAIGSRAEEGASSLHDWQHGTHEGTDPARQLDYLSSRNVGTKRALAAREFALGVEGMDRYVRGEPLRREPECVFDVLVLDSASVDPTL